MYACETKEFFRNVYFKRFEKFKVSLIENLLLDINFKFFNMAALHFTYCK